MRKTQKIHYAGYDPPNESDNTGYWTDPICGTYAEDLDLTNKENEVTCKRCLKLIEKAERLVQISKSV